MRKNYVLDANILIHDPHSIFHFADNTVVIPIAVIGEIDRFKKEHTDRGYNARMVVRMLDTLRGQRSLIEGVPLEQGGCLRVHCEGDPLTASDVHADLEVLRIARAIQQAEPQTPTIIVTKDINLRIRANAAGLRAEDYETDRIPLSTLYGGQVECVVTAERLAEFRQDGRLDLPAGDFYPNEYVMLRPENGSRQTALARVSPDRGQLVALRDADPEAKWPVRPRNKEQHFALDALCDEEIRLVTLMGKAGTGKTLLAMVAAMQLTLALRRFRGVLVGRPIFPMGRDIGFLPGDVGQKLEPWMKPVTDTIEFLLDTGGPIAGHRDVAGLLRSGLLEIQPLTYIRGRSIANRFVVIDEAQNLTPLEVKTVITRMGQGTKVVLTGDPSQIDNPYLDGNSNGFIYLVNRFRDQAVAAHIELRKGERSTLAELAANLL